MRKHRYNPIDEKKKVEAELKSLDERWKVFMKECESMHVDQSKFSSFIQSYMAAWRTLSKVNNDIVRKERYVSDQKSNQAVSR